MGDDIAAGMFISVRFGLSFLARLRIIVEYVAEMLGYSRSIALVDRLSFRGSVHISYAEGARNESFSLGNVKGRDSVARELLCWNTSAHTVCLARF